MPASTPHTRTQPQNSQRHSSMALRRPTSDWMPGSCVEQSVKTVKVRA